MLPSRGDWSAAGFVLLWTASSNEPAKSTGTTKLQYRDTTKSNTAETKPQVPEL